MGELNNGRLAMIAISGMVGQELVNGLNLLPADDVMGLGFRLPGAQAGFRALEQACRDAPNEAECAKAFDAAERGGAAALENLLNQVIAGRVGERDLDPVFQLLQESLGVLPQLIEQLRGDSAPIENVDELIARGYEGLNPGVLDPSKRLDEQAREGIPLGVVVGQRTGGGGLRAERGGGMAVALEVEGGLLGQRGREGGQGQEKAGGDERPAVGAVRAPLAPLGSNHRVA